MQLVADRFVVLNDERRVLDLSSGEDVMLIMSSAGGPSEQGRWAVRCDHFSRLHHWAIARLIDYGAFGETERFEAWRCGPMWRGARAEVDRVLGLTKSFLHANGLTAGDLSVDRVRAWRGRPVVVPDEGAGYEAGRVSPASAADIGLEACGITLIERHAVSALAESLAQPCGARGRAMALWAPRGYGINVAIGELARAARLNGLVPLSLAAADRKLLDVLLGRTLCLIDCQGGRHGWHGLIQWALRSPRPHVLLYAGPNELPHVRGVRLQRVAESALVAAVRPLVADATTRRHIEQEARRSDGLPPRFAELLWGPRSEYRPLPAVARSRAAEQPAVYGEGAQGPPEGATPARPRCWPARGELEALRRRLDAAIAQIARGRHAPGDRALRSAVGCLARRDDWHQAGRGALALAASLLKRGRAPDAHTVLKDAQEYAEKGSEEVALVDVAILSGVAWLDQGRLEEAESVLHSAVRAARSIDEPARLATSTTALARCLFWRGRYGEGAELLETIEVPAEPNLAGVRLEAARSRLAIGKRDMGTAISRAASALSAAERAGEPSLVAEAACAAAFAHLSVGDLSALGRDVALCLRASRAARDPLRALKARLIGAESARRAGRTAAASALVQRVGRLSLPVTIRARSLLLADLLSASSSSWSSIVKRHVAATGLDGLALFAPGECDGNQRLNTACEAAVDILRLCQTAEDEAALLPELCARLRPRLHAVGVAFFAPEGNAVVLLAADGNRIDPTIAARVAAARQPIAPYQQDERIEGGAPVRYGGETLGALVARWTIDTPPDPSQAQLVLTMTATAAGPAVAAALARRRTPPNRNVGELLGLSAVMAEVRMAVERAAAAPFAVLVEGESGCGKELVARALHRRSSRRDRPFCTLNCAALPDDLIEAELFGHARGAFTGAVAERPGVFEEAHTGTLFLDEIGELSPRAQAKVLRTIQDGELRRVGENVARRIDVRIVSATNRDLRQDAAANRFRLDLLYRLDVIRITLPPLRERREDIAMLAEHFWREAVGRVGSRAVLSTATTAALARYDWPGNVRELQNVLAALAVRSPKRGVVPPTSLPAVFGTARGTETCRLDDARRIFEDRFVRAALVRTGGHRARAAEELGITRQGLTKLMARLQIAG